MKRRTGCSAMNIPVDSEHCEKARHKRQGEKWHEAAGVHTPCSIWGRPRQVGLFFTCGNEAYAPAPFMLLYHCNIGYPLLDAGCRIHIPASETYLRGEDIPTFLPWDQVSEPYDNLPEQVFYHEARPDEDGFVTAGISNPSLSLGLDIVYRKDQLQRLTQWKSMASGDYVVGLEPCNCHVNGQAWERANGTLQFIGPGEKKCVDLKFIIKENC